MDRIKKSNITMEDVAKKAGVSKTTISRYLNGKLEYMSDESQKRIQAIIEELNYRPNHLARSLRMRKSRLIGVIIADIGSPISSILVKGISDTCKNHGYNVLIANTDNDTQKEQEYILSMIDQQVEGLIVHTTGDNNDFLLDIAQNYVPIVLADRPVFPTLFDVVKTDDYQSTYNTIQYLVQEGFERVGFFTEPVKNVGTRRLRLQAYHQACKDILHADPQEFVIDADNPQELEAKLQLFMNGNAGKVKAIFTANGVVLLSLLSAIRKLNLRIPQDVGVCGFDNWSWAELIGPGITAISQPSYDVGAECVERILFRLRNKKACPKVIELPNRLIIRGSTQLKD